MGRVDRRQIFASRSDPVDKLFVLIDGNAGIDQHGVALTRDKRGRNGRPFYFARAGRKVAIIVAWMCQNSSNDSSCCVLQRQYLGHVQYTATVGPRVNAGSDFSRIPLWSGKCAGRIIPHMAARLDASQAGPGLDFHVAIDAIPALAWSSHSGGSVDYVNQRWREYTGLSPEESCGRGWKTAI